MTPDEALKRARDAKALLDNSTLKEALGIIEKDVVEAWLACPVRDVEGRESAWRMAVTARKFRDLLRGTAEGEKFALHQIQEKKDFLSRTKNAINAFKRTA